MVNFKKKLKQKPVDRTFQKNRFFSVPKKIRFKLGDSLLITSKETRMELVQIKRIKRLLKKVLVRREKTYFFKSSRIWYYGKTYYYLQKKSKNSRMGKGKGNADRKVLKLKKNFTLFEFSGYSFYKLRWFVNKINKKLNFKFVFFMKRLLLKGNWFNHRNSSFLYKKYLLI